ncbi:MAG: hypothetical protein JNK58_09200 [Phycisphaerae bacterium]|nr:hypothetical protein [Phycisphaerae bacterium]
MKLLCVLLAVISVTAPVSAEWLYSVDVNSNRLCRVDPATGDVEIIGPLTGFDGSISDMEFLGDRLYAVASIVPHKRLLELDIHTGAVLSSVIITDKGTPITNVAEGLGSDDKGNLLISYWFSGDLTTISGQIGILGLDGAVTFPVQLGRDMDGLCRRLAGGLFGMDREPPQNANIFFTLTHSPPTSADLIEIPFGPVANGLDDLTQTRTGLYGLDFATKRAIRFDPVTGAIVSSVPYPPVHAFVEVAAPPPCRGDADGDRDRDFADITAVLTAFSTPTDPFGLGDADGDGDVDFADITAVLEVFAVPCTP